MKKGTYKIKAATSSTSGYPHLLQRSNPPKHLLMRRRIIIAGFGGQGILFLGRFLAEIANEKGYNITWLPSYGPEMRGGTANCSVIISNREIPSPVIDKANILICFNQPSFNKFYPETKKNALVVIDSSLVKTNKKVVKIDATETAEKLGDKKVANMVIGGYVLRELGLYSKYISKKVLMEIGLEKDMLKLNLKVLGIKLFL